ncbi:MAG: putative flippase GtrA [Ascidiaceihabitans sp.]
MTQIKAPHPDIPHNTPSAPQPNEDSMLRLGLIFHLFIGSTVVGCAVVIALTLGYDTLTPIIAAAVIGFIVSIPVTYVVTKAVMTNIK